MKRCPNCFQIYDESKNEICSHCGFDLDQVSVEPLHLRPGTTLYNDKYLIGVVLGSGGFGVTYSAFDLHLEMKVAIKEFLPSEFSTRIPGKTQVTVYQGEKGNQFNKGMEDFVVEAKRLARFNNENGIVKVYDSFLENSTAYIVMEFLDGFPLSEEIKRRGKIPYQEAIEMILPVLTSLEVVHMTGILHRDIAPDNIMVTKQGYKLIDFGSARYASTDFSRSLTVMIKQGYSPEEQYRSRGDQGPYTDVYAISAVLYKMITGVTPPDALMRRSQYQNKKQDLLKPINKIVSNIPESIENAILNGLNIVIEDRTEDVKKLKNELQSENVKRRGTTLQQKDFFGWPLWLKISTASAGVILTIVTALILTGVIHIPALYNVKTELADNETRVPHLINTHIDDSERRILASNLNFIIGGKIYSDEIEAHYVLTQNLNGGLIVQRGTEIEVIVSAGEEKVIVPNLIGLDYQEANLLLKELGLDNIKVEIKDSDATHNSIIKQEPSEGTEVSIGSNVSLTVIVNELSFDTNKTVTVPDFSGLHFHTAQTEAAQSKLILQIARREANTKVPVDNVISQSIAAGKKVSEGTVVSIVVSDGTKTIKMPDVLYFTEAKAKSTLENLGLKVKVQEKTHNTVAKGLVSAQSIKENQDVKTGDTITLTISSGKETPKNWSAWTDTLPSGVSNKTHEIQTETRYRYRDKEETTSSNSSLSGWTLDKTEKNYSNWSDAGWTKTKPTEGELLRISDTKTVTDQAAVYRYKYYRYESTGNIFPAQKSGTTYKEKISSTQFSYQKITYYNDGVYKLWYDSVEKKNWYTKYDDAADGKFVYKAAVTHTEWFYQTRTISYAYHYYRWGSWSDFSSSSVTSNDKRQVETKTYYRYR